MTRLAVPALLFLAAGPIGCSGVAPEASPPHAYELGTIGGFGELVNSGVKTLAMSEVLPPAEMTAMLPEAEQVAARNNVKLYRESNLLVLLRAAWGEGDAQVGHTVSVVSIACEVVAQRPFVREQHRIDRRDLCEQR